MTLHEWRDKYPHAYVQIFGTFGKTAALQVFSSDLDNNARWDLHHLEDFVVSSSVSGPSFIIVPREKATA